VSRARGRRPSPEDPPSRIGTACGAPARGGSSERGAVTSPGPDAWRLDGRVALITGAQRGIGFACAEAFVSAGAGVACVDLPGGELEPAVERLGPTASAHVADIADVRRAERLVGDAVLRHGDPPQPCEIDRHRRRCGDRGQPSDPRAPCRSRHRFRRRDRPRRDAVPPAARRPAHGFTIAHGGGTPPRSGFRAGEPGSALEATGSRVASHNEEGAAPPRPLGS